jgi:hypothetical protein
VAEKPERFLMCCSDVFDQLKMTTRERRRPPRASSHQMRA